MLKIREASDLHLEFMDFVYDNPQSDEEYNDTSILPIMDDECNQILLLSGDICSANDIDNHKEFFSRISKRFHSIFMIMGNHEHYGSSFNDTYKIITESLSDFKNITVLNNDYVILNDDYALFGGTLWTDYNKNDYYTKNHVQKRMNDYRCIRDFDTDIARNSHEHTKRQLWEFLKLPMKNKIIMTHHAPSEQSVDEKYSGGILNYAFFTEMGAFIMDNCNDVKFWFHGHMHDCCDYSIENTRIICNPFGYRYENYGFDGTLLIEV